MVIGQIGSAKVTKPVSSVLFVINSVFCFDIIAIIRGTDEVHKILLTIIFLLFSVFLVDLQFKLHNMYIV